MQIDELALRHTCNTIVDDAKRAINELEPHHDHIEFKVHRAWHRAMDKLSAIQSLLQLSSSHLPDSIEGDGLPNIVYRQLSYCQQQSIKDTKRLTGKDYASL